MLPKLNESYNNAMVYTKDDILVVSTGHAERQWKWLSSGFSTSIVKNLKSDQIWESDNSESDWQLPGHSDIGNAKLLNLSASIDNDESFTSKHLKVVAEIIYPKLDLKIRYTIWAYPDIPGLRTALEIKSENKVLDIDLNVAQGKEADMRVDRIPFGNDTNQRRYIGYYNGTQNRNDTHQNLLKEETVDHPLKGTEWCDWANAACVENNEGGIALVKESNKCVNQSAHATGGFICDDSKGLSCTGWGLHKEEILVGEYITGWATWCIIWSGSNTERQFAFKAFDHIRYPIDPKRDIYIQANTWGSTSYKSDARIAAGEKSVLEELEICADLGIDVLQIDDGWQVPPGNSEWEPMANGWYPHPESYPARWKNVRARAKELGLKLGLWAAAVPVSLEELKSNYEEGGFLQYKLDFAYLKTRNEIISLMKKVRDFVISTNHKIRVNWDVTEDVPRFGYFFAREYGSIFLENRKPARPISVVYRPHTVLRDLWQVSKYLNLHRFQGSIQNIDIVDSSRSDANLHSHSYAVAIALMGIPLFFLETKSYSEKAKEEIRPLLKTYKDHREAIYSGVVHPIGDKPDNSSWTGFQCILPEKGKGYLMIFRERCNDETSKSMILTSISKKSIKIEDLTKLNTFEKSVGDDGSVIFELDNAPDFLFLRYSENEI